MKRLALILSLLLAVLAACTRPAQPVPAPEAPQHDTLAAFDTLMQSQPDSALYALLDFNSTHNSLAPFDRHYADLLLSEALFKCDYEQTLRTEVQSSLLYFDSLAAAQPKSDDNTLLSARAHYMNGVGFMESDIVVDACTEYLKALEIMEEHFEEKELVGQKAEFMVLIYTRLMDLFSNLYLSEQAIFYGNLALRYYNSEMQFPWHVSYVSNEIGAHYEMLHNNDSACFYYEKALHAAPDTISLVYRDIVSRYTLYKYEATGQIEKPVSEYQSLINSAKSEKELLSRCFSLGTIYYLEHEFDSANKYLTYTYANTSDDEIKKKTAEWLIEVKEELGDTSDLTAYARYLVKFAAEKEEESPVNSVLTKMCNTHLQRKQAILHAKERKKSVKRIVVIVGSMVLVFTFVALLYFVTIKRNKDLENQHKKSLEIQKSLSGRLKNSSESLKQEKEKTKSLQKELEIIQQKKSWNSLDVFLEEDICKEILASLDGKVFKRELERNDYQDIILSDTQLARLSTAVEKNFSGFRKMLVDKYPKIAENDINACYLYLLKLNDVQISALLNCGYSTLKKRVTRLKKAFGTEKDLSLFVRDTVM